MLTLRLQIAGAELDGQSVLLPGDPVVPIDWSLDDDDNRVVDYASVGRNTGQIRPRQDYQLAGVELASRPENPIDFLQTTTSSPKERAGVPQIDDFLVTRVSIAGDAAFTPVVTVRESVPGAAALFVFDTIPMVQDPNDPLVWHSTRCAVVGAGQSLGIDSGGVSSNYIVYALMAPIDRVDATAAVCNLGAAAGVPGRFDTVTVDANFVEVFSVPLPLGGVVNLDVDTAGVGAGTTVASDKIQAQFLRDSLDNVVSLTPVNSFGSLGLGAARNLVYNAGSQRVEYSLASGGAEVINWITEVEIVTKS